MFKIINCSFIFSLLFISTVCQTNYKDKDTTNSSSIANKTTFDLHLNPFLNSHKLFLGQKDYQISTNDFQFPSSLSADNRPNNFAQLKMEINEYLIERRDLLSDYNLGEFGKYLGYANTLAVVIMAIAHISKYGFK